jgi:hypothetical protein
MINNDIVSDYAVSESEKERFRKACEAEFTAGENAYGIGTLREKKLHAAIKRFISPDLSCHEIKLADIPEVRERIDAQERRAGSKYVADILSEDGDIYEVQTGSLCPLKGKINWYLHNTDYYISVVYPVPYIRWLCWIEPEGGGISRKHRSPKRGSMTDVARELYWVRDFIGNKRFSLRIMFIDMEEYRLRNGWDKSGKRGSERCERIPVGLEGTAYLNDAEDYRIFLPDTLPFEFTASQYSKETGIRGKSTYSMLKILCSLGFIEATGEKSKRSELYRIL